MKEKFIAGYKKFIARYYALQTGLEGLTTAFEALSSLGVDLFVRWPAALGSGFSRYLDAYYFEGQSIMAPSNAGHAPEQRLLPEAKSDQLPSAGVAESKRGGGSCLSILKGLLKEGLYITTSAINCYFSRVFIIGTLLRELDYEMEENLFTTLVVIDFIVAQGFAMVTYIYQSCEALSTSGVPCYTGLLRRSGLASKYGRFFICNAGPLERVLVEEVTVWMTLAIHVANELAEDENDKVAIIATAAVFSGFLTPLLSLQARLFYGGHADKILDNIKPESKSLQPSCLPPPALLRLISHTLGIIAPVRGIVSGACVLLALVEHIPEPYKRPVAWTLAISNGVGIWRGTVESGTREAKEELAKLQEAYRELSDEIQPLPLVVAGSSVADVMEESVIAEYQEEIDLEEARENTGLGLYS